MELVLNRKFLTDRATIGELARADGQHICWILEDVVRSAKIKGRTAIPAGRYRIGITMSPRFKRKLPLLLDVPYYTGVRIHPGNSAEDTEGCLMPGLVRGTNFVGQSRAAFDKVFSLIASALAKGEECWITINNPPGAPVWEMQVKGQGEG
ncbi:MAG TPA: DUF5675 family protein [Blastocatellia bacterium]|nr:DUF5675 family protein [Blastocatellia bacterium]